MFKINDNVLIYKKSNEILIIQCWNKDSFRIRSTVNNEFSANDWALTEETEKIIPEISISDDKASITNGILKAEITSNGVLSFYKKDKKILQEYYRYYDAKASKESICLKIISREYKNLSGDYYNFNLRFNSDDSEQFFGMGQYQMKYLDLKGCNLELSQRNSQSSVPFVLSSLGYGFFWNNPGTGRVEFGKNLTQWTSDSTKEMDYWITAGETPFDIIEKYTAVTGRVPEISEDYLGFWQCKLRYRTQDEVLSVARKYKELGIKLDVIVIDFFHWIRQGDWGFDKEYWPDPKAMCDELHEMGTKVMVSVWPSVDKKSIHFNEMMEKGYLLRIERGSNQSYDFNGDCLTFDSTNPEAREYIYQICKENYLKYGIDMFWLDNAEPDLCNYDYSAFRSYMGNLSCVGNIYPSFYAKAFYDGMTKDGYKEIVNLERCAWAGSQKYGVILWNGDVQSTFECLRDSVSQGINMGIAGLPWWTTDIGGFMNGNVNDPEFIELLERWFQWAVFTPFLRLHGDREPHDIPPLSQKDYGGGYLFTGNKNEIWSFGDESFEIFKKQIKLRESLKPYIKELMIQASKTGKPLMRAMFLEFPEDKNCWKLEDQYMFGDKYIVAPILQAKTFERKVYLPKGQWKELSTGECFTGPMEVIAKATRDSIPVFERN